MGSASLSSPGCTDQVLGFCRSSPIGIFSALGSKVGQKCVHTEYFYEQILIRNSSNQLIYMIYASAPSSGRRRSGGIGQALLNGGLKRYQAAWSSIVSEKK